MSPVDAHAHVRSCYVGFQAAGGAEYVGERERAFHHPASGPFLEGHEFTQCDTLPLVLVIQTVALLLRLLLVHFCDCACLKLPFHSVLPCFPVSLLPPSLPPSLPPFLPSEKWPPFPSTTIRQAGHLPLLRASDGRKGERATNGAEAAPRSHAYIFPDELSSAAPARSCTLSVLAAPSFDSSFSKLPNRTHGLTRPDKEGGRESRELQYVYKLPEVSSTSVGHEKET